MFERRARLSAPANVIFEAVSGRAKQNGFNVEASETQLKVDAPLGLVFMNDTGAGIDMRLEAESPEKLQLFTDLYAQRFAEFGLEKALTWEKVGAKAPLNQMLCTVVSSEQISPNFRRVRLAGDFQSFKRDGAGLHFRFLFSQTGQEWPYLDERGITVWPDGTQSWHRPPYTVRRMAADASWMDVDIYVHDGGKTTNWAQQAAVGSEIAIHGPSGGSLPTAKWLGLFGDETALPVILHMIEAAPAETKGVARIFLRDLRDVQDIETQSGIELTWGEAAELEDIETALVGAKPTQEDYQVMFCAERRQAGQAREVFTDLGLDKRKTKAASYWTR